MIKEILQLIASAIMVVCGLCLTAKYNNGLLLMGIALIVIGLAIIWYTILRRGE